MAVKAGSPRWAMTAMIARLTTMAVTSSSALVAIHRFSPGLSAGAALLAGEGLCDLGKRGGYGHVASLTELMLQPAADTPPGTGTARIGVRPRFVTEGRRPNTFRRDRVGVAVR